MSASTQIAASPRAGLRAFLLFDAAWLASFALLAAAGRPVGDPLALLVIFGLVLPGIAWLTTRGIEAPRPAPFEAGEAWLLLSLVVYVTAFLAVKGPVLAHLVAPGSDPRLETTVNTLLKLVAFVLVPVAAYALRTRLPLGRLGLAAPRPAARRGRLWLAFAVIGALLVAIQLLLGRGARPLLDGSLSGRHWIVGLVLCFLWMSLEAGLVEELFFRVLLQSRLEARFGSPAAGLFVSALIFGLAHAPGLWLRGAGVVEGLGPNPGPLLAAAYAVTTMGIAGLVFGVLWMRTRSLLLLVALHGLTDALSNTAAFMDTWRL